MVDVWNELGKALGRALRPLAEIPAAIWRTLGDATGDLIEGFIGAAEDLGEMTKPTIDRLLASAVDEMTLSLGEDSPPKEIEEAVKKMVEKLMTTLKEESKTEGHSLPTSTEMDIRKGALITKTILMYATTHAISVALDASHPIKDWGFKSAAMDMMYQFKMSDVVGPMLQAPIWASVIVPMRMLASAANPYAVPGVGVLPYLLAKGIIDDDVYKLNMKYSAYNDEWSDAMLANTWRYPGFGDMRTMIHRGVATWADARKTLEMNLVQADYIDAYEATIPSIPGVGDLVRFAVREAYPDAETFTEHYARMSGWIGQQGYSQYFADAFWTAHWIIPTVSQADELLHRGDIDEAAHRALYILNDIRPEDIDQLRGLTWKLPGRIEARWMFRWGEIDASDLRDYLVKDGLDPVYADSVAQAMAKQQFLTDINREIANVKADYSRGYSVEATLRADLAALGMRDEIVEYHVADALADRTRSILNGRLSTLRAQYSRGAITLADAIAEAEKIIVDKEARDAWVAELPTSKQVMIMEETYGTEINRLVTNVKYDYVRGYVSKVDMVSRLQILDLPDRVVEFHVMDADEDRSRKRSDDRLIVIKDMWMKDVETDFDNIEEWVREIIVDDEARELWLGDTWFDKMRTVTR